MTMRTTIIIMAAALLAACDGGGSGGGGGGGGGNGPLQLRVIAGNGQSEKVTRDTLFSPVVAQLTRGPSAGMAFRLVRDAHAQTGVVGVPGEQVCAVGVGDIPLVAWNPCAITNAEGIATFFFNPGNKAGVARAEVRAVINGQPVVTDSVSAVVEPGPPSPTYDVTAYALTHADTVAVDANALQDAYGNPIPFTIEAPADSLPLTVTGHVVRYTGGRTSSVISYTLYLLDGSGARGGRLMIFAGGASAQMYWRATGLGVP